MLRVIVDEREKPSGVPDELHSLGVTLDYRLLEVGDYIVRQYAVERKSTRDFFSSLYSGRLFDQARRLGEAYQTTLLVVEGSYEEELRHLRNPRSFWGAIISAVLDFGLECFFTPNSYQTAQFIYTLAKGGRFRGGTSPQIAARKPKSQDVKRVQLSIVSSLPGVGPRMADQLLIRFGSVRRALAASVTDMAVGARIGRARALSLSRILDAPYESSKRVGSQARLRED